MFYRRSFYGVDINRVMGRVSTGASIIAGSCMLAGFVLLIRPGAFPWEIGDQMKSPAFPQLLVDLRRGSPIAFMALGLLVLAFIPILRVIVALLFFWQDHNLRYVFACIGVLCVLAISMLLAR